MNFQTAISDRLASHPILHRILTHGTDRQKHAMEARARDALGIQQEIGFDWSSINWEQVFEIILKALIAFLPVLLAL